MAIFKMDGPAKSKDVILTAKHWVEMYYYRGRESRPDLSLHLNLIKREGLIPKFKYVALYPKTKEHSEDLKDMEVYYFFDPNLTLKEFKQVMQIYDSCRTWSRTDKHILDDIEEKYNNFTQNIDGMIKDPSKCFWFVSEDKHGRIEDEHGLFHIRTSKFVRDSIDVQGFNDK